MMYRRHQARTFTCCGWMLWASADAPGRQARKRESAFQQRAGLRHADLRHPVWHGGPERASPPRPRLRQRARRPDRRANGGSWRASALGARLVGVVAGAAGGVLHRAAERRAHALDRRQLVAVSERAHHRIGGHRACARGGRRPAGRPLDPRRAVAGGREPGRGGFVRVARLARCPHPRQARPRGRAHAGAGLSGPPPVAGAFVRADPVPGCADPGRHCVARRRQCGRRRAVRAHAPAPFAGGPLHARTSRARRDAGHSWRAPRSSA